MSLTPRSSRYSGSASPATSVIAITTDQSLGHCYSALVLPDASDFGPQQWWAATDPRSGRFETTSRRSGLELLAARFETLTTRGRGYVHVSGADDYPVVALGFRGDVAVIQAFASGESVSVLSGDGSVASGTVEVLVMDDLCFFSARNACTLQRGWSVIELFWSGVALANLGEWTEL